MTAGGGGPTGRPPPSAGSPQDIPQGLPSASEGEALYLSGSCECSQERKHIAADPAELGFPKAPPSQSGPLPSSVISRKVPNFWIAGF